MTSQPNMSVENATRISKISGMVVGKNGKGGSGTCVLLENGTVALLTAKHVIIECLRNTGEIAIAVPASGIDFHIPRQIRIDSSQQGDAAFLVSDQLASLPAVPFEQWSINNPGLAPEMKVVAFGFPADFKKVVGRRVNMNLAFLGDKILSVQGDSVICGINETVENIPRRFDGMSGGGLFSETGEFLGIVVSERRNVTPTQGELEVSLPSAYQELYKPYSMPLDGPGPGFYCEEIPLAFNLRDSSNKLIATIGVKAEAFWSSTHPEHKHGRIGRLTTFEIIIPGIKTHYPMNIESLFFWAEDSHEARLKAAQEEFKFFLLRMGWLLNDGNGDSKTVLHIRPMI